MKTIIIAEAGINHNADLNIAFKLIDEAVYSGADIIKFQTAVPEEVVTEFAEKADYQKKNTGKNESQLQMTKKLHLPIDDTFKLFDYANKKNIKFLTTSFDPVSTNLISSINMDFAKIPSGEINNLPYIEAIAKLKRKVILSTGMSTIDEIEDAMNILIKTKIKKKNIYILHCNTEYPTPFQDVNLKAMLFIKDKFRTKIGYSDHTKGIEIPIAAVSLGANIIEKHFTLSKNFTGPDHKSSLEPKELKKMIVSIRNVELALGLKRKFVTKSEKKNKIIVRKSLVAAKDIIKGEVFNDKNLTVKRPGNGISPMQWYNYLGKISSKNYKSDEQIENEN